MSLGLETSVDVNDGSRRDGKLIEGKVEGVAHTATIAPLVSMCFSSFERLRVSITNKEPDYSDEITSSEVSDAIGRFRIWSSNIGAHKTGRSSLEYRLRDASHIRERVQALLQSLNGFIEDGTAILEGEKTAWDKIPPRAHDDSNATDSELSDSSSDGSLDDETELRQLMTSIKTRITLLMRLSMAIRKPAAHDQFLCSGNIDTSHFHEYDIRHVRERFPKAPDHVVKRLGTAISKRRQYFKYRGEHAKKLARGSVVEENNGSTGHQPQSTIASSLPQAVTADPSHLDLDRDEDSDTGMSQTSFASSTGDAVNGPRLPPMPQHVKEGMPFECPFCFMLVSIRTKKSWRRHVYKDLHPYVCTYPECLVAHRLFEGRREWFQHEREMHRHYWTCQMGCSRRFLDRRLFKDHLMNEHNVRQSVDNIVDDFEHAAGFETTADCCLCGEKCLSLLQLRNHLGDHQRQLASFALPMLDPGENDENEDDNMTMSKCNSDISPAGSESYDWEHLSLDHLIDDVHQDLTGTVSLLEQLDGQGDDGGEHAKLAKKLKISSVGASDEEMDEREEGTPGGLSSMAEEADDGVRDYSLIEHPDLGIQGHNEDAATKPGHRDNITHVSNTQPAFAAAQVPAAMGLTETGDHAAQQDMIGADMDIGDMNKTHLTPEQQQQVHRQRSQMIIKRMMAHYGGNLPAPIQQMIRGGQIMQAWQMVVMQQEAAQQANQQQQQQQQGGQNNIGIGGGMGQMSMGGSVGGVPAGMSGMATIGGGGMGIQQMQQVQMRLQQQQQQAAAAQQGGAGGDDDGQPESQQAYKARLMRQQLILAERQAKEQQQQQQQQQQVVMGGDDRGEQGGVPEAGFESGLSTDALFGAETWSDIDGDGGGEAG